MNKTQKALKLALGYMNGTLVTDHLTGYERKRYVMEAIREALAEQPTIKQSLTIEQPTQQQEPAGYFRLREYGEALIHDQVSEDAKHNEGVFPLYTSPQPAQQQEPDRVKFERHWRKTRGEKKANRELPRHPLQPQTYTQDSANRHWVTWQAAVRSVAPPASKPWVGLTKKEVYDLYDSDYAVFHQRIEAKLREKNAQPSKPLTLTDEFCITDMIDVGHYSLQLIFKSRNHADKFKAAHGIKGDA